ncbi:MAG: hypothetical protein HON65_10520 [Rhodospirillales bacterium]|nr:hypothetical protein [Rhodospirillales bacterium]
MKLKQRKSGWLFYCMVFIFLAAGLASIDLTFDRSIRRHFMVAIDSFLAKKLDLAEPVSASQLAGILTRLPGAVIRGEFPARFDDLQIDIKYKYLEKIKQDRTRSVNEKVLRNPGTYPVEILYAGETYKASMRLKGDFNDHRVGADRWSFRVKLKDGKTILGFNQFSLHKPTSRQIPFDHLYQHWMRAAGNLGPRHNYIRVNFNGDDWGVMDVEEHMSKQFLELARRKVSPIINLASDTDSNLWYRRTNQKQKLPRTYFGAVDVKLYGVSASANRADMQALYSYGVNTYRQYRRGEKQPGDFLDYDSFSKALIGATAWKNLHTLSYLNSRIYINPYTLKWTVITTDQGNIKKKVFKRVSGFYLDLLKDPRFESSFNKNLDLLDKARAILEEDYDLLCQKFPLQCPGFDIDQFNENFDNLKNSGSEFYKKYIPEDIKQTPKKQIEPKPAVVYPPDIRLPRHFSVEYYADGYLNIYNLLGAPTEVLSVTLHCKKKKICESTPLINKPLMLPFGMMEDKLTARVKIPVPNDLLAPENRQSGILGSDRYIKVVSRVPGVEGKLEERARLTLFNNLVNPLLDKIVDRAALEKFEFTSIRNDQIYVSPGTWMINKPIVLPRDMSLNIAPGTVLNFASEAYLIVQGGSLTIDGTSDNPVRMQGVEGGTWKGLYVVDAPENSRMSHVTLADTNYLSDGVLMLTGGVTFYKSDVSLSHVTFAGSQAEDALNIVHSDFDIKDTVFSNTRSDAFDSDFSNGVIQASRFTDIHGDGLDTSGSEIVAKNLVFSDITDKAISVGEKSIVTIENSQINHVGTGIVSKDGSHVIVRNLDVQDFELFAGMAYQKKEMYGPAELQIEGGNIGEDDVINQTGSILVLNNRRFTGKNIDVDALYAAGSMKKVQ